MDTTSKTLTVRLPKTVIRTLNIHAAQYDYTISAVVEAALLKLFEASGVKLVGDPLEKPAMRSLADVERVANGGPAVGSAGRGNTASGSKASRLRTAKDAPATVASVGARTEPTKPLSDELPGPVTESVDEML